MKCESWIQSHPVSSEWHGDISSQPNEKSFIFYKKSLTLRCFLGREPLVRKQINTFNITRTASLPLPLSATSPEIFRYKVFKNMKIDTSPLVSSHQRNQIFVKFVVSFLLIGLAFRLLVSNSFITSPVSDVQTSPESPPSDLSVGPPQASVPVDFSIASQNASAQCDIFTGAWVPDPSGPVYTNITCRHIQDYQNCLRNGRPDVNYLFWRWKPRDCDLPRFSPERFLNTVRNKWWAFIGDSISRNHVQSLLCTLSQVEEADEVYHDKEYKSKIWRFPSHNFTLSVTWSPFLVKAKTFEDPDGVSSGDIQLYLDQLDGKWTDQYHNFDYVVISGGKWFLKTTIYHENNTITGCHYCQRKNNLTELGYDYSYRKALRLVFNFVSQSNHKPLVLFRTTTPDHFENGEWNSGGVCNRTMPFREGEAELKDVDTVMREIELEEFQKAGEGSGTGESGGSHVRLLDTTIMSLDRPDGHPGPYRHLNPFAGVKDKTNQVQNDCLHWCLPGPIDSWNDLLMELMLNPNRCKR
ncbi:PREDICTED: protein trichome birefringence-like 25 [Tarenaya hassleriana]|uniref:protein trichome birefringence-like 25 n=1 Tax=Tarenaya hassleriana TaxID=28532 RepID=UPI0008FD395C|nr:PREDICTED: protein trichome birefringence-like 25 [Tarenaya hassleriana]